MSENVNESRGKSETQNIVKASPIPTLIKHKFVVLSIVVLILFFIWGWSKGSTFFNFNTNPTVERLEKLGQLAGLKVFVGDVLTAENEGGQGFFSGVKGVWIIKGDALLATDMKKSKMFIDEATKQIQITLEEPQVLSPRVDHKKTHQYELKDGLFTGSKTTAKLHQAAMQQAQLAIETAANSEEYKALAIENIEMLLSTMIELSSDGWEAEFKWIPLATEK